MNELEIKTKIKQETLRLMFAVEDARNLSQIEGVDDYLDKMDGSIERAIVRICQAKKAGYDKIKIIDNLEALNEGLDLSDLAANPILQIDKVFIKSGKTMIPFNAFYTLDYKTIVIEEDLPKGSEVIIYYYPAKTNLAKLREDVIAIIPLFVKSELYEEDEYNVARQARSLFESELQAININSQTVQTKVVNIFGGI